MYLSNDRVIVKPPPPKNWQNVIFPSAIAINLVPSGAGISIPVCEEAAPAVGALRFPKGELIFVYPGIGQTNPSGLKSIISESKPKFENELEFMTGMKNIDIKIKIMIIDKYEKFKSLWIKSPPILWL